MDDEYLLYKSALATFGLASQFWGNLNSGGDDPVTVRARAYVPNPQDMADTNRIAEMESNNKRNSKREQRRRKGKK